MATKKAPKKAAATSTKPKREKKIPKVNMTKAEALAKLEEDFTLLRELNKNIQGEGALFIAKSQKAVGRRVRAAALELKKLSMSLRTHTQEVVNNNKLEKMGATGEKPAAKKKGGKKKK